MKIIGLILLACLLTGCAPKHYILLPDPYLQWEERQNQQRQVELQQKQIELQRKQVGLQQQALENNVIP